MEDQELQAAAAQPEGEALPEAGVTPGPAAEGVSDELSAEELLGEQQQPAPATDQQAADLKAVLEAIVYVLNEPMPAAQIAQALDRPLEEVEPVLRLLAEETSRADRGIFIREVAGGYQMATKPEHHEVLRNFVKNLKQPLKLSQAALETLAVIAYKQPITMPEILEIRGVQGGGVVKTLIDRKLITTAGRKNVIGKPMLYKTTKEFLTQFGLKDVLELPSLKEFEEIRRQSIADEEFEGPAPGEPAGPQAAEAATEPDAAPAETPVAEETPTAETGPPESNNG
jgi:segregation and condensation protein B